MQASRRTAPPPGSAAVGRSGPTGGRSLVTALAMILRLRRGSVLRGA